LPPPFTMEMLREEVEKVKAQLRDLPLKIVTGHGDFKPANLMASHDGSTVVFVDFELSGPNYRGFDIFKLYRRGQLPTKKSNNDNQNTKEEEDELCLPTNNEKLELRKFVSSYLSALKINSNKNSECASSSSSLSSSSSSSSPSSSSLSPREENKLLAEVLLFEPLTWLEASIFFLFALTEDEEHQQKWSDLAIHRWDNYMKSKNKINFYASELMKIE